MNFEEIIYSSEPTNKALDVISIDQTESVLFNDFEEDIFKRAVLVKLDNVPVIITSFETKADSSKFISMLKSEENVLKVLHKNRSDINRHETTVTQTKSSALNDKFLSGYFNATGIEYSLYIRNSKFSYNEQMMELNEYILPGLKFIMKKYENLIS